MCCHNVDPCRDRHHARKRAGERERAHRDGHLLDRVRDELETGNPEHGARRKPQPHRLPHDELLHKQVHGHRDQRLGQARADRHGERLELGHASRHQDQRHRQALGHIVDGEAGGDEGPEMGPALAAEGHADAEALGEGVEGHDRDDEADLRRLQPSDVSQPQVLIPLHVALGVPHEHHAQHNARDHSRHVRYLVPEEGGAVRVQRHTLRHQAVARRQHHARSDGIGGSQPEVRRLAEEEEGKGPEPRRQCGEPAVVPDMPNRRDARSQGGGHGDVGDHCHCPDDSGKLERLRRDPLALDPAPPLATVSILSFADHLLIPLHVPPLYARPVSGAHACLSNNRGPGSASLPCSINRCSCRSPAACSCLSSPCALPGGGETRRKERSSSSSSPDPRTRGHVWQVPVRESGGRPRWEPRLRAGTDRSELADAESVPRRR
mmetsp:Transcript_36842/g.83063  ORF Transcript_36842/g.83063 Transcript_36842/m.83063 type:complete len:436 (+) Transcript_36842:139-1446(+)